MKTLKTTIAILAALLSVTSFAAVNSYNPLGNYLLCIDNDTSLVLSVRTPFESTGMGGGSGQTSALLRYESAGQSSWIDFQIKAEGMVPEGRLKTYYFGADEAPTPVSVAESQVGDLFHQQVLSWVPSRSALFSSVETQVMPVTYVFIYLYVNQEMGVAANLEYWQPRYNDSAQSEFEHFCSGLKGDAGNYWPSSWS